MNTIGPATEAQVLHAFLRAETDPECERWAKYYAPWITPAIRNRLIESPSLENDAENVERLTLLSKVRSPLIERYLRGKSWECVTLTADELKELRYPSTDWSAVSPTGRVGAGAETYAAEPAAGATAHFLTDRDRCCKILNRYVAGEQLAEPIAVTAGDEIIVVEGCVRVTAYVMANLLSPLRMFLGKPRDLCSR